MSNDSIGGYPTGLEFINNESTLLTTNATLKNTRIRNSSSSLRTETKGAYLNGHIAATIDSLEIEDYSIGIYYESDGTPFNRTIPVLSNTRIRNSSSSLREPLKGLILKNLGEVIISNNIIYPNIKT